MTPARRSAFTLAASIVLCALTLAAAPVPKNTQRLQAELESASPEATLVVWVYLSAKPAWKSADPERLVSARSLRRRLKVRAAGDVVDGADWPLDAAAVSAVAARVQRLRQRSKWLNAVSVEATPAQVRALESLSCVRRLDLVARSRRDVDPDALEKAITRPPRLPAPSPAPLDYGNSLEHLAAHAVPAFHGLGFDGQGVFIGHFDNGYRLLGHEVFDDIRIVAGRDFVDGDADPAPAAGAPVSHGGHGIVTLSVLGGFRPGQLVGVAYGASYVLARTEDDASETPIEEDNWVAAIEWADSIGIDVASTSLGYTSYDAPYSSWTWHDMDGSTTAIVRAADMAVARGIVVLNAAGNGGLSGHNTLVSPADGDSVIAVGALDEGGVRSSFSSVGPTTDTPARIKPDVMARGRSVWRASATDPSGYGVSSGTSLACPIAAGIVALLLEASPAATPMQIRDALRLTANNAASPDNEYGWGSVNALAALNWLHTTDVAEAPARFHLAPNVPNPFNPSTRIAYTLVHEAYVTLRVYDAGGRLVRRLQAARLPASQQSLVWDGTDDNGSPVAAGVYLCRLQVQEMDGAGGLSHAAAPPVRTAVRKMVLVP